MSAQLQFRCIHRVEEKEQTHLRDAIFLYIARGLIVTLLAVLGFLLSFYFDSIGQSLEKLSAAQETLAVHAARIDEAVQNIDRRLSRIENQTH